jgi:hypothetical protein
MVAILAGWLSTMAFCPVGTFPRLQFPAVFQSVLLPPVQKLSWALAVESPMAARALVTREIPRLERWNLEVLVWSFMGGLDVMRWVRDSLPSHGYSGKNRQKLRWSFRRRYSPK